MLSWSIRSTPAQGVWLRDYTPVTERREGEDDYRGDDMGRVPPSNAYQRRVAGAVPRVYVARQTMVLVIHYHLRQLHGNNYVLLTCRDQLDMIPWACLHGSTWKRARL